MTHTEYEDIVSRLAAGLQEGTSIVPAFPLLGSDSTAGELTTVSDGLTASGWQSHGVSSAAMTDSESPELLAVESIAAGLANAQSEIALREAANERPAKASSPGTSTDSDSVASSVLKTAALVTGVGPVITGLLSLFGGSDDTPAIPALSQYVLPQSISVEAGLSQDRSIVPVGYAQSGESRSLAGSGSGATPSQIQINVNALDSRSILDHSDEIAQAVRSAMLRSHALNDVVAEI